MISQIIAFIQNKILMNIMSILSSAKILYLIAAIALILIAYFLIRRRKKKQTPETAAPPEPSKAEAAPVEAVPEIRKTMLKPSELKNIWNRFIKQIPREYRRAIQLYQPFVVMGEPGCGKSFLIDHYTDWKGQSHQFYPSLTDNPLLQVYLGSTMVIQEISSPLLGDISHDARIAFQKLWKPLFRKKEPRVVLVLKAPALLSEHPEYLKNLAQMMRGKINLIAEIWKKPVKVHIALRFMDHIDGFSEFFDFLGQNNIPFRIGVQDDPEKLPSAMEPYEVYLKTALTTQPPDKYIRIITFFRQAPQILSMLTQFLKILQSPDPFSLKPAAAHISFTSDREKDSRICNPFISTISPEDVRRFNPYLKHQIAAAAVLCIGIGYLLFGYYYVKNSLIQTDTSLKQIEMQTVHDYQADIHPLFPKFARGLAKDPVMGLLPDFFPSPSQNIRLRLLSIIRSHYLIPYYSELQQSESAEDMYERSLILLGLIYASKSNDLGRLVNQNMDIWTDRLNLPGILITDYLNESETSWDKPLPIDHLRHYKAAAQSIDPQPYVVFLNELESIQDKSYITQSYFDSVLDKADKFLQFINDNAFRKLLADISDLLKKESPADVRRSYIVTIWTDQAVQKSVGDFLQFIRSKQIDIPSAEEMSLHELLENIKVLSAPSEENQTYSFYVVGKDYSFSAQKFNRLLTRSRITLLIRSFIKTNSYSSGRFFFRKDSDFPPVVINPTGSDLFYTNSIEIDGRLTRKAVQESMIPALQDFSKIWRFIPIFKDEQTRFSNFIMREVDAYAKDYAALYQAYYNSFRIQAAFPNALELVLYEMQLPTSQFYEFLFTLKDNTVFELEDNPFLNPFIRNMQAFASFKRLFKEDKGAYPELERYKYIIGQMYQDLRNTGPYMAANEADEANELRKKLSSLGRMSLSMFRNEENSYYNMAKLWIKDVGISPDWERVFLEPFTKAFEFGKTEIEIVLESTWKTQWERFVRPLTGQFPFDVKSDSVIDPKWMEDNIHPKGVFWENFSKLLAPVCEKTGNYTWRERTSAMGSFKIPEQMFADVNAILRLNQQLWDQEGKPKPMRFSLKSHLMPPLSPDNVALVLSFIHCGSSSIFAFNQQQSWQDFELEWWKRQPASVGVEYIHPADNRKSYKTISVAEAYWSFHSLLRKGLMKDEDIIWEMPNPLPNQKPIYIQFSIKPDPWEFRELGRQ